MVTPSVILAFGNGDIGIALGVDKEGVGCLAFKNIPPHKIGPIEDEFTPHEITREEFPVIVTFSKIESVDVAILALEKVKEHMLRIQKEIESE